MAAIVYLPVWRAIVRGLPAQCQPIPDEMEPELSFEEPHAGLQESYRSLVREFVECGEPLVPFPLAFPNEDFPAFLSRLSACANGEGIPEGFVPHSTYWLVRNGSEVIGVSNLRHRLTDGIHSQAG